MKKLYNYFLDHVSGRLYKYSIDESIHRVLDAIPNLDLSISLAINCKTNAETLS